MSKGIPFQPGFDSSESRIVLKAVAPSSTSPLLHSELIHLGDVKRRVLPKRLYLSFRSAEMEPALWVLQVCSGVLAGACQKQHCTVYLKGFSGHVSMTVSVQHLAEDSCPFPARASEERNVVSHAAYEAL